MVVGSPTYTPSGTGGGSGNPVVVSLDPSSTGCTLAGGIVTFAAAGTCLVDLNQAGSANYNAAPQVQQSISVGKGSQAISFTPPASGNVGGGATLSATGGGSGNPVTFTIDGTSTAGACSLSGSALTYTGVGSCIIDANQAGNANYNAAPQVQKTIAIGKGSQTITFAPPATGNVGGGTTLSATGGASGNPVTFTIDGTSTAGACSLSGSSLTYTGVGNCIIDANQAGDANYNAAPQVQKTISVGKGAQTITFAPPATGSVGGGTTLSATGGASGNPVSFTIDGTSTAGACSLSGSALTYTGVGNCIVDANQAGNANYNAAPQVQQTITIGKGTQAIAFAPPTTGSVGGGTTLSATGGASGNPVTFTIDGSSTVGSCSLAGSVLTYTGVGSCVIDANQAGSANYNAAPQVQKTISVGKGAQTITFTPPATGNVGGGTTLSATGGASGNPVTFTIDPSSTLGACSLTGSALTYTGVGNCVIDANQAGNANYNAAPQVQKTIAIGKGSQAITPSTPPTGVMVGSPTYSPSGTGGASGSPVVVTVDLLSVGCSLSGGVVTFTMPGTCLLDFNQAGSANYNAAPQVQQSISVGKGAQTISFTPPTTGAVGGGTTLSATGGGSGNPVTFSIDPSSTTGACSLTGSALTYTGIGNCVVDANQAGNANYNAAPQVQQTITVGTGAQSITFTPPTTGSVGGGTTLSATGGASGNPVTFTIDPSSTLGACSLTGSALTYTGVGSCVIDANQAGNANYAAAPQVQQTIAVGKGSQAVTPSTPPSNVIVGSPTYNPNGTGGGSGNPVVVSLDPSSTGCTLAGGVVTFTAAGTCIVDFNQAGNANYNAAPQVQQSISVGKAPQAITFTPPTTGIFGGGATLSATGGASGNPVTFTIDGTSTTGACSLAGATLTYTGVGNCVIDANQAGNTNYAAAPQVQQTIAISKASQAISPSTPPTGVVVGSPTYTPSGTGGGSGNPVVVSLDPSSTGCTLAGGIVTFAAAGTCLVDLNQAGSANYNAAPQVQQSISVGKGSQAISFTPPASGNVGGGATLSATGGGSGNPVTFTIDGTSTAGACSLSGSVLTYTGVGSCIIDANQAGNANYNAAPQVQKTIAIGKGPQPITFAPPPTGSVGGGPTLSATGGGSGNPSSSPSTAPPPPGRAYCPALAHLHRRGNCVVDANQAGSANYNAAPRCRRRSLSGKGTQTITFTPPATGTVGVAPPCRPPAVARQPRHLHHRRTSTAGACSSVSVLSSPTRGSATASSTPTRPATPTTTPPPQVQKTITIGKGTQTIIPSTPPSNVLVGSPTYTPTGTGGASGNPVVVSLDASSTGCTLSSGKVTFSSTGTCLIDFNQAGSANYDAASQVQQAIVIGKISQTITFSPPVVAQSEVEPPCRPPVGPRATPSPSPSTARQRPGRAHCPALL